METTLIKRTPRLTKRQKDVLALVALGLTNQCVADELKISINGVKFHMLNIFDRLGAESRTQAVVSAIRFGLLDIKQEVGIG